MKEAEKTLEPEKCQDREDLTEKMVKGRFGTERVGNSPSKSYVEKLEKKLKDVPILEARKVRTRGINQETDLRYVHKVNDNAKDKIGGTNPDLLVEGSRYSILVTNSKFRTKGHVAWIDGLENVDTLYSGKIEDEEFQKAAELLENTDIGDYLEQRGYKL